MEKNQERMVRFYIRKLGLPEQETLENIQGMNEIEQAKAMSDLMIKSSALDLGLSENATEEEVIKKLSEKTRETAINLGLPENTTSEELCEYELEQERLKIVKELCLPENATWEDIMKYKPQKIEYSSDELKTYKEMLSNIHTDSIPTNDIDLSTIPEDINTIKKH